MATFVSRLFVARSSDQYEYIKKWIESNMPGYTVTYSTESNITTYKILDSDSCGVVIKFDGGHSINGAGCVRSSGTHNWYTISNMISDNNYILYKNDNGYLLTISNASYNRKIHFCFNTTEKTYASSNLINYASNAQTYGFYTVKGDNLNNIELYLTSPCEGLNDVSITPALNQLYVSDEPIQIYVLTRGWLNNSVLQSGANKYFVSGVFALPE